MENLKDESKKILEASSEYAKFYEMPTNVDIHEITEDLLQSHLIAEARKKSIRNHHRKIFVFTYPSDRLKIKGLISIVPDPQNHPLLVVLRGGNRIFGIPNPAGDLICFDHYTVICTTYRGGISEGEDEFGGADVNDVKNLIDFIPDLENKLNICMQKQKMFLLGASRGGMQLFLTLARFPELQSHFTKIVSLSGLLDMQHCITSRIDMEDMFIEDFGLIKGVNEEEWIAKRDPLLTVKQIQPQLPILILQGTEDARIELAEGYTMVNNFKAAGCNVTYKEIEGGDHCLSNREDRVDIIKQWLEE